MSQFDNVSVIREANIYFDGKVTSRTVLFADGTRKTLGVMQPGEYEFSTSEKELMEILAGSLQVKLPGEDWQQINAGQQFYVSANAAFQLKVETVSDYCCSYLAD
ncbi:pyrimidine/purine nucleoside phosphorylase [Bowmanella yangjiangensis]|uniref:Pyrimidine/purine nucleoside phosphorylase n=1 Tax=Bowmanella yangjiangensis TaxID=2811230 RepID=A0ABS3CMT6_9ALTE|nr:pyrimidine/purine nucleoside phosphorylase [Bowmanella yangjiangensis]MBN7818418.1 pyrimidine/purine nucleoside phosphorylase [Bowmanella yangjiangensis]